MQKKMDIRILKNQILQTATAIFTHLPVWEEMQKTFTKKLSLARKRELSL